MIGQSYYLFLMYLFVNVLSLLDACLLFSDPIQKQTNKKQKQKQHKAKQKTHIN